MCPQHHSHGALVCQQQQSPPLFVLPLFNFAVSPRVKRHLCHLQCFCFACARALFCSCFSRSLFEAYSLVGLCSLWLCLSLLLCFSSSRLGKFGILLKGGCLLACLMASTDFGFASSSLSQPLISSFCGVWLIFI